MNKKTLIVGVIGSGAISDIYLQNMTEHFPQLQVKAVASAHIENAEKKASKYGLIACTVDQLMEDPDIDMIVNLTPVGAHYQLIKDALLHGKHVYTEKTMTDSLDHSEELIELANEKGLYLGSAPDTFLGSALQTARTAIDDGLIGEVQSFMISANRNNDLLLSVFSFLRQPGAGVLNDYGVYYMTALTSLLGPVKRVGGSCRAPYKTHLNIFPDSPDFGKMMDTPNESQASAVITMESGVTGTFHICSDTVMKDEALFVIYGSKGMLWLTDPNGFGGKVRFQPMSLNPFEPAKPVDLWNFTPFKENSRGVGPADMAEAILTGNNHRASKEMAYHVQEVLAAILEGGEQGCFTDIRSTFQRPEKLPNFRPSITGIGHTSFTARDMDAMLYFYKEVLGLQEVFTLTLGDLCSMLSSNEGWEDDSETEALYDSLLPHADQPWIVYLKLADHQYIELFFDDFGNRKHCMHSLDNRRDYYGYTKCNFEIDDINELREHLISKGITLEEDIHDTLDGNRELVVKDPDGNEVQFTEYYKGPDMFIPMEEDPNHKVSSRLKYTTQVAFQIKDEINMPAFYSKGLGLKKVNELSFADLSAALEKQGADQQMVAGLRMLGCSPWIEYFEIAPHQYLELFHCGGQEKKTIRNNREIYGFQHICLEVSDIKQAYDAICKNGLKPDSSITLGADNAYQFWVTDPDGHRVEIMQYTKDSLQLL